MFMLIWALMWLRLWIPWQHVPTPVLCWAVILSDWNGLQRDAISLEYSKRLKQGIVESEHSIAVDQLGAYQCVVSSFFTHQAPTPTDAVLSLAAWKPAGTFFVYVNPSTNRSCKYIYFASCLMLSPHIAHDLQNLVSLEEASILAKNGFKLVIRQPPLLDSWCVEHGLQVPMPLVIEWLPTATGISLRIYRLKDMDARLCE